MADNGFRRADGDGRYKEGIQPGWGAEGIGGAVTGALRSTASAVSAQASDLVSSVSEEVVTAADQQKERGADAMKGVARAIGGAAENLDEQSPALAKRLRTAAHSIESLSDTVKDRSLLELSHEATGLAKRQPIAFFTGAVVAGFALARFLKSSAPAVPHAISADSSHQSNAAE
jgi:hypothetical protein